MGSDIKVHVVDTGIKPSIEKVRLALPLGGRMRPLWENIGRALKTSVQMRFRKQVGPDGMAWKKSWRAEHEGGQTLSMSRRLRNSITYEASETGVTVGTNVAYAAAHQFGATIRAKAGPFLAIPLTPQARSAGSPRNFPGLHVQQSAKGQFMLADEKGVVHYLLRSKVVLPARPFLGVNEADEKEIVATSERFYEELWR